MLSNRSQEEVARNLHASMTMEILDIIANPAWKGSALIVLDDMVGRPSATTLARNAMWLKPFVKASPKKASFST